jgi:hypothetical protein
MRSVAIAPLGILINVDEWCKNGVECIIEVYVCVCVRLVVVEAEYVLREHLLCDLLGQHFERLLGSCHHLPLVIVGV